MISSSIPKFVHNRGHGFSKRLYPAGVYYFNHRYCPAPCLYISPLPGRMAERAQLQPLPCMNLTPGPLVKRKTNIGVYFNTAGPRPPPTHTVLVINFPIVTHTQIENFKLKDPRRHPHKLVSRRGSHSPTDGSTLGLGSKRKELTPRGKK